MASHQATYSGKAYQGDGPVSCLTRASSTRKRLIL